MTVPAVVLQGDLFSGLNDGLLSRAEALDIGKHQGAPPIKHDMMYHHAMPPHNTRTHQVSLYPSFFVFFPRA